jgi:hypothetical protein
VPSTPQSVFRASSSRTCDLPGLGFVCRRDKLCHRLDLHVAVLQLPLVILFQQYRADQSNDRCFVGEYADDIGPALHLLVQPFQRVCAVQLGAVLSGEVEMRQNIGLAVIDERGELRPFLPQLIRHVAQRLAGLCTVRLDERLPQ